MMMVPVNTQLRKDVMDAVQADCTLSEIAKLTGKSENYIYTILAELVKDGKLRKVSKGRYAVVIQPPISASVVTDEIRPFVPKTNGHLAETLSRKVALPDYMRTRAAITLYVEKSPEEIEGVMRLELNVGGAFFPVPVTGDMRLCVGADVPRWSATQEVYNDVRAYRITKRDGMQLEYAHNPGEPITIDRKF